MWMSTTGNDKAGGGRKRKQKIPKKHIYIYFSALLKSIPIWSDNVLKMLFPFFIANSAKINNHLITISGYDQRKRKIVYGGTVGKHHQFHHHSPMDVFAQRSTNMPIIWEKIVDNLSVIDVANCMKTSKTLRTALQQTLNTNTQLRRDMNHAATVSAIAMRKVQSRVKLRLQCEKDVTMSEYRPLSSIDCVFALDGMWYYKHGVNDHIDLLKMGPDQKKKFVQNYLITDAFDGNNNILVFPTLDANRAVVNVEGDDRVLLAYLIDVKSMHAKVVSTIDTTFHSQKFKNCLEKLPKTFNNIKQGIRGHEVTNYRVKQNMPYCARYRLYTETEKQKEKVFMMILSANGDPEEYVQVYKLKFREYAPDILHTASNEEVGFHYLNSEHNLILFQPTLRCQGEELRYAVRFQGTRSRSRVYQ